MNKVSQSQACRELWVDVFLITVSDAVSRTERLRSKALNWLFSDMYAADRKIIGDRAGINIAAWQVDLRRILIDREYTSGHKIEMSSKKLQRILLKVLRRHCVILE